MLKKLTISQRGIDAPASPIRKLVPYANTAKNQGARVYHLNIGDPDFEIPNKVKNNLMRITAQLKNLSYAPSNGIPIMIEGWQKYYQSLNIHLKTEEITVTSGGSEALILSLAAIADPGDEILVMEPYYANYAGFANLLSLKICPVTLKAANGYHLPPVKEILAKINKRTKAILITNPNNPTGTVLTETELITLIKIAEKEKLFIISDETYQGLCFDGRVSSSVFRVVNKDQEKAVVVVDSLSKRFNLCGARLGAVITKNKELQTAIARFSQTRLSVATLEQIAVAPMLSNCSDYIEKLAGKYQKRRDVFIETLEKELRIKLAKPEGAFYSMLNLPVVDSEEFAKWLLTDFRDKGETVMVAPGAGFYATPGLGHHEVRVAYVLEEKKLIRAGEILAEAIKKYPKKIC